MVESFLITHSHYESLLLAIAARLLKTAKNVVEKVLRIIFHILESLLSACCLFLRDPEHHVRGDLSGASLLH